ncbi:hypothetical protein Poly24_01240 [Rosistilla carotiformis]|uniref:Uncharacterized protein n=1 Tax=Rosistilla carotiformis TaxID=2528017 RepID=A0A518JLM4_9BACT|nr:hypothetical protein [Rosistilla carotiformis]QDV66438.1 hypothetical protein Poly24_01240 [Rosistilla carotiformis]
MIKTISLSILVSLLAIVGCSDSSSESSNQSPTILLRYKGDPLANVRVQLHDSESGPVVAAAISDPTGQARFKQVSPSGGPQYFVSVESISDGGWILDPKLGDPATSGLSIPTFDSTSQQPHELDLPPSAVRLLTRKKR